MKDGFYRAAYEFPPGYSGTRISLPGCERVGHLGPYAYADPASGPPNRSWLSVFYRDSSGHYFSIREILRTCGHEHPEHPRSGHYGDGRRPELAEVHLAARDRDTFVRIGDRLHSRLDKLDHSLRLEQPNAGYLG